MKQTNIKILFLSFVLLSLFSVATSAQAAGNFLFVSPASATVNAGSTVTVSASAGTSGDKICAVKGTILFHNMTCQNITLASGLLAQTAPTCSSPSFVIGIPKCATTNTSLFTVTAVTGGTGEASISFSGVNLIGVGASAGSTSTAGNYTVTAAVIKTTPKPTIIQKTVTTQPTVTTTTLPTGCTSTSGYSPTTGQSCSGTVTTTPTTTIPANAGAAALANSGASKWFNWILIILVFVILIYVIYYFATRKKK